MSGKFVKLCLLLSLIFGEWASSQSDSLSGVAQRAVVRRQAQQSATEGQMLAGDRKMADGDAAGAYETYRDAVLNTPRFAAASTMQNQVFRKYQDAARRYADELARQGRVAEGVMVMEQIFTDAKQLRLPDELLDQKNKFLLEDLKDGKTYEPANSPGHLKRVASVKRLLYQADSEVRLGKYDEATTSYAKVLNLDPYNASARKGMRELDRVLNKYHRGAYDQMRATQLSKVSKEWEMQAPRLNLGGLDDPSVRDPVPPTERDSLQAKLNSIMIPAIEFDQTPLKDALQFLAQRSQQLDDISPEGEKGVNIIISGATEEQADAPISLRLRQTPLGEVLRFVTELGRMKYRVEQFAVNVVPLTAVGGDDLVTKRYKVPPTFLSDGAIGGGVDDDDPFGGGGGDPFGGGGGGTTLKPRLSAQEYLKQNGIQFPDGAVANFNSATSTLLVRNTQAQLELIEGMIDAAFGSVAKMLKFDIKILDISDQKLGEIGFDWLMGQFNVPGSDRVFAGGGTLGTTGLPVNSDGFPFQAPGAATPLGGLPITAGNRSNLTNQFNNSIDGRLQSSSPLVAGRAPAAFSIGGVFTDPQFQGVVNLLSQRAGRDLGTTVSVVSRAGQIASVRSVREFIYPSEYDAPEIPDSVGVVNNNNFNNNNNNNNNGGSSFAPITPAHPAAFDTRELGSLVEVEGLIDPDGQTIQVTLNPSITEFEGFINYGTPIQQLNSDGTVAQSVENRILMPVFRTLRETTNVNVYDGHTIAIGGYHQSRINKINDKVPLAGNIPGLGKLFRTEASIIEKRAIVFFVTVKIIDPSGNPVRNQQPATAGL